LTVPFRCLYFSVVTFTTLGDGDLHPVSDLGRLLVMMEVGMGTMMLSIRVAILVRRVIVS
jgi:Ion channel